MVKISKVKYLLLLVSVVRQIFVTLRQRAMSIVFSKIPILRIRLTLFTCVVCGRMSRADSPGRESMQCHRCGATWRARAMVLGVLQSLGYSNTALKDAREDLSIRGLGTSDDIKIVKQLVNKFDYVNTYYHKGPKLDLTNVDPQWRECAQFVICSDVLEHVPPPTHSALEGLFSVVASGGAAIISIPYTTADATIEFYPELERYEVEGNQVVWHDSNGVRHIDDSPEFHGGAGQTLAFRVWSLAKFEEALLRVGFSQIERVKFNKPLGVPPLVSGDAILIARK